MITRDLCPVWCDGSPTAAGKWCDGGDAHRPWPVGVVDEFETVKGENGSTANVAAVQHVAGGPIDVSLIVRSADRQAEIVVPLSVEGAMELADLAQTVSDFSHRGGEFP
jgi:hypothetical protein